MPKKIEPPIGREFISIAEAARLLGCSPRTVRRMISSGRLVAYRLGPRLIRVNISDVQKGLRRLPATDA